MLAVIALLLAACGGDAQTDDGSDGDGDAAQEDPQEAEGDADDDAPEQDVSDADEDAGADGADRTFVMAVPAVPEQLDLAFYEGDSSRWVDHELFFGGTYVSFSQEGIGNDGCDALPALDGLTGQLADSWSIEPTDDGGLITITLKQGVLSPLGNELTTADVQWTFDRNLALDAAIYNFFATGVAQFADDPLEVIDDYTFQVRTTDPSVINLTVMFGAWVGGVYDSQAALEHATEEDPWAEEWLARNAVTFGGWYAHEDDFDPGNEVVLRPNDNFWGERGNIDRVVIRAVPESSTRLQLLEAGEVHHAKRLTFQEYSFIQDEGAAQLIECPAPRRSALILNYNSPPFDDLRVREAVSLATDRDAIAQGAYQGFAAPAISGFHQGFAYPVDEALAYRYDPDRARELLAEAGAEGLTMPLTYTTVRGPELEQVAVLLQSQLGDVGIEVDLNFIAQGPDFTDTFYEGRYDAILDLEGISIPDPYMAVSGYQLRESTLNSHGHDNPAFDALAFDIRDLAPGPEREQLTLELANLIVETNPWIYLIDEQYTIAFTPDVSGYRHAPHGEVHTVNLSID